MPFGRLDSGELDWHTDQSYMQKPAICTVIHAIEDPENGPKTYWANVALAYASHSDKTKRKLEGKRGVY